MSTTEEGLRFCVSCKHHHIFFLAEDHKLLLNVCQNLDCTCHDERFIADLKDIIDTKVRDVIENFDFYTKDLKTKKETIQFSLDEMGFTRNFSNKDFLLFYWLIFDAKEDTIARECIRYLMKIKDKLSEPETVRRAKQEAVEEDKFRYGPTDEGLIKAKLDKELEYFTHYSEKKH